MECKTMVGKFFFEGGTVALGLLMAFAVLNGTPVAYEYTMESLDKKGYIDR